MVMNWAFWAEHRVIELYCHAPPFYRISKAAAVSLLLASFIAQVPLEIQWNSIEAWQSFVGVGITASTRYKEWALSDNLNLIIETQNEEL